MGGPGVGVSVGASVIVGVGVLVGVKVGVKVAVGMGIGVGVGVDAVPTIIPCAKKAANIPQPKTVRNANVSIIAFAARLTYAPFSILPLPK